MACDARAARQGARRRVPRGRVSNFKKHRVLGPRSSRPKGTLAHGSFPRAPLGGVGALLCRRRLPDMPMLFVIDVKLTLRPKI